MAQKKWEDICKPHDQGGFGFRKFKDFNLALLSKLAWKMAREENALCTRAFRARYLKGKTFYLKGKTFFKCKLQEGTSSIWRGVIEDRPMIRSSSYFKIGNGFAIHPLFDPQIPKLEDGVPQIKDGADATALRRVVDLKEAGMDGWNVGKLKEIFPGTTGQGYYENPLALSPM